MDGMGQLCWTCGSHPSWEGSRQGPSTPMGPAAEKGGEAGHGGRGMASDEGPPWSPLGNATSDLCEKQGKSWLCFLRCLGLDTLSRIPYRGSSSLPETTTSDSRHSRTHPPPPLPCIISKLRNIAGQMIMLAPTGISLGTESKHHPHHAPWRLGVKYAAEPEKEL